MKHVGRHDADLEQLKILITKTGLQDLGPVVYCRYLATELGMQLSPAKHWTWNYLHQILRQKLPLSQDLRIAIRRLIEKKGLNDKSTMEQVTILAPTGFVVHNTISLIKSRTCDRLGCGIQFLPKCPSQKYHSPECRYLARKLIQQQMKNDLPGRN